MKSKWIYMAGVAVTAAIFAAVVVWCPIGGNLCRMKPRGLFQKERLQIFQNFDCTE